MVRAPDHCGLLHHHLPGLDLPAGHQVAAVLGAGLDTPGQTELARLAGPVKSQVVLTAEHPASLVLVAPELLAGHGSAAEVAGGVLSHSPHN